jgi:hypothetical protein
VSHAGLGLIRFELISHITFVTIGLPKAQKLTDLVSGTMSNEGMGQCQKFFARDCVPLFITEAPPLVISLAAGRHFTNLNIGVNPGGGPGPPPNTFGGGPKWA